MRYRQILLPAFFYRYGVKPWQKINIKIFMLGAMLLMIGFYGSMSSLCFADTKVVQKKTVTKAQIPQRVVSLVPSAVEIIQKLGMEGALAGITYYDTPSAGSQSPRIVGGFFEPNIDAIEAVNPDVILLSKIHKKVYAHFSNRTCRLIQLETTSIADSFDQIMFLGRLFDREQAAKKIVADNKAQLALIKQKIDTIPKEKRKRVIRLMGRDKIMTPGMESFQNEMIRAAGGLTHEFNQNGRIISPTIEQWTQFNPQVIYGCGGDKKAAQTFFDQPGWKTVEAVKKGHIFYYPCELTCRASTNTGYFVSWLAANVYADLFVQKAHCVTPNKVLRSRSIVIDLPFIKRSEIVYATIYDFLNKTLIIDFKEPLSIVSTLDGMRSHIKTVGNHFSPPQYWAVAHDKGLKEQKEVVLDVIGRTVDEASFLFTGADMDNLAVEQTRYKALRVYALVTAGVKSNAMRMSRDAGLYYEPGTINIIVMTNMKLAPRAMNRAIITATEAKTAALLDMDIRSSYALGAYRATGTGTDNVLVVQGIGAPIENAGGHSKLGELIAKAVYAGVRKAVFKQNRLTVARNIFQRLKERDITIFSLIAKEKCDCGRDRSEFAGAVEAILLKPEYAGFLQASLAISDDYEKGLVTDLSSYKTYAHAIAQKIAGREIGEIKALVRRLDVPRVIRLALNMIFNGVYYQENM